MLTHYITTREARAVARELRAAGYEATADNCREYVSNVADRFEPGDPVARRRVIEIIERAVINTGR